MNPVIAIGMVAVIAAGLYAIYSGLELQAELGAIQSQAAAGGRGGGGAVSGEITKEYLKVRNNGAYDEKLVQVRGYDIDGTLLEVHSQAYDIPAWNEVNLTGAGTMINIFTNNINASFVGVLASGVVFSIESIPDVIINPPGYGDLAIRMAAGGTASQVGMGTMVEYYYSTVSEECLATHADRKRYVWEKTIIYDQPFLVSSTGLSGTPKPEGSPTWWEWDNTGPMQPRDKNLPTCGGRSDNYPSTFVRSATNTNVYENVIMGTSWDIDLRVPISDSFTIENDGTMMVRLEGIVQSQTEAEYDWTNHLSCLDSAAHPVSCDCRAGHDAERIMRTDDRASRAGDPSLSGSVRVEKNGHSLGTFPLVTAAPVEDVVSEEMRFIYDGWKPSGSGVECFSKSEGYTDAVWQYDSEFGGWLEIPVSSGDAIDLDGSVRLRYNALSGAGTPSSTYGEMSIGDVLVMLGWKAG